MIKEKLIAKSEYGNTEILGIWVERFEYDNTLAIILYCEEGLYADLTICLGCGTENDNESFVDTNNFKEALAFIEDYKLGKVIRMVNTGNNTYPLVAFDMERLNELSVE